MTVYSVTASTSASTSALLPRRTAIPLGIAATVELSLQPLDLPRVLGAGVITQDPCTSFLAELLQGLHDFATDSFALALIRVGPNQSFSTATTNYSQLGADEMLGAPNYTAGGIELVGEGIGQAGQTVFTSFRPVGWRATNLSVSGALLYNVSKDGRAVAVFQFSTSVDDGELIISFGRPSVSLALLGIAQG